MDYVKQLEDIIKNDILIEVEDELKELEKIKKRDRKVKDGILYMQEVKRYFDEVIIDIEKNLLTQEQALDILEGLEDMKIENQEI